MSKDKPVESRPDGSIAAFDHNWQQRPETQYNHWIKGYPKNQIQFAFRNHWEVFSRILYGRPHKDILEVGAGRGSLSSYFADSGSSCVLLDTSESILKTARTIFQGNGHDASFVLANALQMPFKDNSFDVVVSIGLLEHFEDIQLPISEQIRVLRSGGTFLGYIVPERPDNIQRYFNWINLILKFIHRSFFVSKKINQDKASVYRSDFGSERYLKCLENQPIDSVEVFGMYCLPMISHSPDFPFSLLPPRIESALTRIFGFVLFLRGSLFTKSLHHGHPWTCREKTGQAFLVAFRKI